MLLLATLAGVLAGCGSSHSGGTSADPAGAAPASTPLYVGATVKPTGSQQTAALAAGRALTHQSDPYLRLLNALQPPGSPPLDFKSEVEPWLGPHAATFLSSLSSSGSLLALLQQGLLGSGSTAGALPFGAGGVQGAIVMDTSDASKAQSFLNSEAARAGAHATSYRGVSYQATSAGVAYGIVQRFAVIGSESGLRSVIDTTLGGPSLADASGYKTLLASAPSEALAHIYSNPASAKERKPTNAGESTTPEGLSSLLALLAGEREANVSLVPAASSITLDADTLSPASESKSGGLLSASAQGAKTLAELPGESWFAVGLGDVSQTLASDVQGLRGLVAIAGASPEGSTSGTLNLKGLLEGLFTPLGILGADSAQAKRDFRSWMGTAGIFASGASLLELKGAVVIESRNPGLSRAAVRELGEQLRKSGASLEAASIAGADAAIGVRLPGLPVVMDIADGRSSSGQTKFVLGLGEASVTTALDPPNMLSGAASYSAASSALGEGIQPSILFDFPTFLSLLEGVGLSEDPTIAKFIPYLRTLTTLAGGGRSLGGELERFKLILGLTPASPAGG